MRLVITIEADGPGFRSNLANVGDAVHRLARAHECARILEQLASDLRTAGAVRCALHDGYGNAVGTAKWEG